MDLFEFVIHVFHGCVVIGFVSFRFLEDVDLVTDQLMECYYFVLEIEVDVSVCQEDLHLAVEVVG